LSDIFGKCWLNSFNYVITLSVFILLFSLILSCNTSTLCGW